MDADLQEQRISKDFSQISEIRVSKNTVTSNFAKSNLFDLTLSQAFSNNKNDLSVKLLNSIEKAQFKLALCEQASSVENPSLRTRLQPGTSAALKIINSEEKRMQSRAEDNSRPAPSKGSRSRSRDLEIVDVDDYWAKWLEFKNKNQKVTLVDHNNQRESIKGKELVTKIGFDQPNCKEQIENSQIQLSDSKNKGKQSDFQASKDCKQELLQHNDNKNLSIQEEKSNDIILNSPQGYQGEQQNTCNIYKDSRSIILSSQRPQIHPQISQLSSSLPGTLEGQQEIENLILRANDDGLQVDGRDFQVQREHIQLDKTQELKQKLMLSTAAVINIQRANNRQVDFQQQIHNSPFDNQQLNQYYYDGAQKQTKYIQSEDVCSDNTFENQVDEFNNIQVDNCQQVLKYDNLQESSGIDRKTIDIMDLMRSEQNHMTSFKQAHQCLQHSLAKQQYQQNVIETQDDCHSMIREENSPGINDRQFYGQEENIPINDSIDIVRIKNKNHQKISPYRNTNPLNGSSIVTNEQDDEECDDDDRSICEEFMPQHDMHNFDQKENSGYNKQFSRHSDENVHGLSQDGDSEYRVPVEIKSFMVANSVKKKYENAVSAQLYQQVPSTPELESETSQHNSRRPKQLGSIADKQTTMNRNSSSDSIISSRQLDEHQNYNNNIESQSKSLSQCAIDYSYLVIGQKDDQNQYESNGPINQPQLLQLQNVAIQSNFNLTKFNQQQILHPNLKDNPQNFQIQYERKGFQPEIQTGSVTLQGAQETRQKQLKGGSHLLQRGGSMLMTYLTNFNSKSQSKSNTQQQQNEHSKDPVLTSLLMKTDDQEYYSNTVSQNLNCHASRGRLIETQATRIMKKQKKILKIHKSCENLQGIRSNILLNEEFEIDQNDLLRQSLKIGFKVPLTVRSRYSGLSSKNRENRADSRTQQLDREFDTQMSQRSLSREMNRNQKIKKIKQNFKLNAHNKFGSRSSCNYYSCRNMPNNPTDFKNYLQSPLMSTSKLNQHPISNTLEQSSMARDYEQRRMLQLFQKPQKIGYHSNQMSLPQSALHQQMKKSLSISALTAKSDSNARNQNSANWGVNLYNQSNQTLRRLPMTNVQSQLTANPNDLITENSANQKQMGQFMTFDARQQQDIYHSKNSMADLSKESIKNKAPGLSSHHMTSNKKQYPPRPPSSSHKKRSLRKDDQGHSIYFKQLSSGDPAMPLALSSSSKKNFGLLTILESGTNREKDSGKGEDLSAAAGAKSHEKRQVTTGSVPGRLGLSGLASKEAANLTTEDDWAIMDVNQELSANLLVQNQFSSNMDSGQPGVAAIIESDNTDTVKEIHDKQRQMGAIDAKNNFSDRNAAQKRIQSIANYYNILNQHLQNKIDIHQSKTSLQESVEKHNTVIGDNTSSQAQNENLNSPGLQNLQALTINYNSNQNYQSINFYDEVNKDNNQLASKQSLKKEESSILTNNQESQRESFKNGDYTNQFSTIKRCQQNDLIDGNQDREDDDVVIKTERHLSNVDSFFVQADSAGLESHHHINQNQINKKIDIGQPNQLSRPLLSFEKIKNIEASLSTLRITDGQALQKNNPIEYQNQHQNIFNQNTPKVDQNINEKIKNDLNDTSYSVSQIKNELSRGVTGSFTRKNAKKVYSKSPTLNQLSKQTRRIMISLNNSGHKDVQNGENLSDMPDRLNGRNFPIADKLIATENKQPYDKNQLDSSMKISQSLTQNLSYRKHLGAMSPNDKSMKLMTYRSQNSEMSEFYDNYSRNNNSNKDSRTRMQHAMNKRKRLKRSRNKEQQQHRIHDQLQFQSQGENQQTDQTVILSKNHMYRLKDQSRSGNLDNMLHQKQGKIETSGSKQAFEDQKGQTMSPMGNSYEFVQAKSNYNSLSQLLHLKDKVLQNDNAASKKIDAHLASQKSPVSNPSNIDTVTATLD